MTPDQHLLEAAASGHLAGTLVALDAGADINVRDTQERTALCIAVECGHLAIISALLERKADLGVRCYADMTALHLAARDGRTEVVSQLLAAGAGSSERLLNRQRDGLRR